jgi:hypothetical protein
MDPFVAIILGGLVVFGVIIWLLGRFYPGSGLEQVGVRSAREITETREALEANDLEQMVAARNARRRARGETAQSASELELQVARDAAAQERRRERYRADRAAATRTESPGSAESPENVDAELDELLALTNARRRARGLSERSRDDARQELGPRQPPAAPGER